MSEFRNVRLCFEDIEAMERAGEELMRSHKATQGLDILVVALRLRQEWAMHEPLAEVVDLHDFPPAGGRVSFDLSDYVDVAEREHQLFERHPDARIQVELDDVRNSADEIIAWKAKATIWRTPDDPIPVCDFAVEPVPGKTPYTRDSEAMNASTSAVGRAIVLAGFPSKKIASADEVRNREGNGWEGVYKQQQGVPQDLPPIPEDARPSEYVIHFGKNRGVLLGALTAAQLAWYATKWEVQDTPSDYDLRLKAAAVALNVGDDTPLTSVPADMEGVPFA